MQFFQSFPDPYRRSLAAYTAVLIAFALAYFAVLFVVIEAAERKLIPVEYIGLVFLGASSLIYVTASRVAKRAADRVLRKAGEKP